MPYKDYEKQLRYRRERAHKMKLAAIEYLGGKCVDCTETNVKELEFDHVRGEKTANLGCMFNGSSLAKIKEELDKCELRCLACHAVKDGRLTKDKWGEFKREGKTSVNHG